MAATSRAYSAQTSIINTLKVKFLTSDRGNRDLVWYSEEILSLKATPKFYAILHL
ncbi:hypothetical protein [Chamaesiphon sp.]|uniref:hypothetical protein n=1 Tax=Chamaesiphon sp. TaxID=2814140 RepID=UPI0035947722